MTPQSQLTKLKSTVKTQRRSKANGVSTVSLAQGSQNPYVAHYCGAKTLPKH